MSFSSYSAFEGPRLLVTGSLPVAALATKRALEAQPAHQVLIIDNRSGRNIDVDLQGSEAEVSRHVERMAAHLEKSYAPKVEEAVAASDEPRGRGRPKLGVMPREVTLLPRHWDWLATQPGGASVTLRKLVEEARRKFADKDRQREAQERAYNFMLALAGDLPGYEEATRALFANDRVRLESQVAAWPKDLREHALWLAMPAEAFTSSV
jgi:hypothetical protein